MGPSLLRCFLEGPLEGRLCMDILQEGGYREARGVPSIPQLLQAHRSVQSLQFVVALSLLFPPGKVRLLS